MSKVNKAELAQVFECSVSFINTLLAEGIPYLEKGENRHKQYVFSTREAIEWYVKRANKTYSSKDDAMKALGLREAEADVTLKEIKVSVQKGELIAIGQVIPLVEEQFSVLKSRINALPGRLAQTLASESDPAIVLKLIRDEVSEALKELSTKEIINKSTENPPENLEELIENAQETIENFEELDEKEEEPGDYEY